MSSVTMQLKLLCRTAAAAATPQPGFASVRSFWFAEKEYFKLGLYFGGRAADGTKINIYRLRGPIDVYSLSNVALPDSGGVNRALYLRRYAAGHHNRH